MKQTNKNSGSQKFGTEYLQTCNLDSEAIGQTRPQVCDDCDFGLCKYVRQLWAGLIHIPKSYIKSF